jgi:hypothetical protein
VLRGRNSDLPRVIGRAIAAPAAMLAALLASATLAEAPAQPSTATPAPTTAPNQTTTPKKTPAKPAVPANPAGAPNRYLPNRFAGRAGAYYKFVWGVDALSVKLAESGAVVRFSWRVLDPDRAKALNEKAAEPSLEDPQAGVSLVVPTMENIGKLRQESPPEAGKSYWMVFSNKGQRVKRGDRVNVVIGQFRAEGLAVD